MISSIPQADDSYPDGLCWYNENNIPDWWFPYGWRCAMNDNTKDTWETITTFDAERNVYVYPRKDDYIFWGECGVLLLSTFTAQQWEDYWRQQPNEDDKIE